MNAMAIFSRITRRHAEKSTLCASLCLMPVTTTLDSYGNKAFRFANLASRGKPRQLAGQHPQVRRHDTGRTRRGDRTVHCDRVHARPSARRRRPAGDQKHRSQRSQSHSGDPCTASRASASGFGSRDVILRFLSLTSRSQSSLSTRSPCRWATRRTQRWNAPCCSSMRP
mgnify:CR=1 FL=1